MHRVSSTTRIPEHRDRVGEFYVFILDCRPWMTLRLMPDLLARKRYHSRKAVSVGTDSWLWRRVCLTITTCGCIETN